MTVEDFLAYKYTLYNYASEASYKLYVDASTGKRTVNNDFVKLKALLIYTQIVNEYQLNESVDDDQNMFPQDEMEIVINHLNKLCETNYNINFDLEE